VKRKQKAYTLVELVIALGIAALLVAMALSLFAITLRNANIQQEESYNSRGSSTFQYFLTLDMKAAYKVEVQGVKLYVYQNGKTIEYVFDNKKVIRDGEELIDGDCDFVLTTHNDTFVELKYGIDKNHETSLQLHCGSKEVS